MKESWVRFRVRLVASLWIQMLFCVAVLWSTGSCFGADTITIETLLNEMVDREAIARFPEPAYTCKQFSSYFHII